MTDKSPLITKEQAAHITKMFKSGKFPPQIFNYLGITLPQHYSKTDPNYRRSEWSSYDPLYCAVLEKAHNWMEEFWIDQMEHMDAKKWQFVMRAKFGWSIAAPYREPKHNLIKLEHDKPSKLLDAIIQEVTDGTMSTEKGKAISDLVLQSYNVKEIEGTASDSNEKTIKEAPPSNTP